MIGFSKPKAEFLHHSFGPKSHARMEEPLPISIGFLREDECDSANEVWVQNYDELRKSFTSKTFKSWRFFVACALTHAVICWISSVPFEAKIQMQVLFVAMWFQTFYVLTLFYLHFYPRNRLQLYEFWTQTNRRFLVAKDESKGRIVGTIAIERSSEFPTATEVRHFRVLPEYQNLGIGTRLMKRAERVAKRHFRCQRLVALTVPELVSGIRFFMKHGYRLADVTRFPNPYRDPKFLILCYGKDL